MHGTTATITPRIVIIKDVFCRCRFYESKGYLQPSTGLMSSIGSFMKNSAKRKAKAPLKFGGTWKSRIGDNSRLKPNFRLTLFGKSEFIALTRLSLDRIIDKN